MRPALLLLAACSAHAASASSPPPPAPVPVPEPVPVAASVPVPPQPPIDTVFLIVMENRFWSSIHGSKSAPFLNSLLPSAAYADDYHKAPHTRVSEPNYIWLEAGDDYGLVTDRGATEKNSVARGTPHLTALLDAAGISWKAYQEDMPAGVCPLVSKGRYAAKHDPFVFFRDVTDDNDPQSQHCLDHIVPFPQLADDLAADRAPRYAFLTPNVCHDMHGATGCKKHLVEAGDRWLANVVPMIEQSPVYQRGHAAILITWDEGADEEDRPIGLVAISPHAKPGYASELHLSHSSTLRTLEEILGVAPLLGDAANATSLADLFTDYP